MDRFLEILNIVKGMDGGVYTALFIGIAFGIIMQYTRVDKFEKIAGFSMLKDTVFIKMVFLAIGLSSIGLYFMVKMGYATYTIKPLNLMGLIVGGAIFGISMAILGKCPAIMPVSIAEGRIDVLVGAIGGFIGGAVFVIYFDKFSEIMGKQGENLSVLNYIKGFEEIPLILFGLSFVIISLIIPLKEEFDEEDIKKLK